MNIIEVNSIGQYCPMPLLLLKKAIKQHDLNQVQFLVKSSDKNSKVDLTRYCQMHQLQCNIIFDDGNEFHYQIFKA